MSGQGRDHVGRASSPTVFALRPLNITDLLDMVIRIYRRHFGELIAIAAVVYVPLGVLQALSMSSMMLNVDIEHPPQAMAFPPVLAFIGLGVWALLMWLSMPLMQAAMAKAVSEHYLGGRTSLREAYDFALGRWLALIVVAVALALLTIGLMGLGFLPAGVAVGVGVAGGWGVPMTVAAVVLAVVGMLLAMVGIAYVGTKLFFGALAVVLESAPWPVAQAPSPVHTKRTSPAFFLLRWWEAVVRAATHAGQGLRRSWELTEGHFWRVLGTMALLLLMVNVAAGIIVWPVQLVFAVMGLGQTGPSVGVLHGVSALAQLLCQPLQIIGTVLLYYDLRIRKEGFDLSMMAEAIREPERAPRAPSGEAQAPLYGPPGGAGFQPATRPAPPPPPPPGDPPHDQQGPLS